MTLRHRLLLAAALAAAALAQSPALAQAGEDAVARCRSLTTDAERIACLENALLGTAPATAAPATTAPRTAASEAEELERRALRLPGIPFIGGDDGPRTRTVVSSDTPEAAGLGANTLGTIREQVEAQPHVMAAVVRSREVPYKRLEVELDNGQVWRQTASDGGWDFLRYDEPEHVEIWATRTGGFRMRHIEEDLVLRVERVR